MRRAALVLAAVLGGCDDAEVERLAALRAEVCACTSVACADAALARVPAPRATPDHRMRAHARAMLDCRARIEQAPAAPDAGAPVVPDAGAPVTPDAGAPVTPDAGAPVPPDAGAPAASPDAAP